MQKLIDTLYDLTYIESITGNERGLCDFVERRIRNSMPSTKSAPSIQRIKNSLVIIGPSKPERKTICMAGHFDTVPGADHGGNVRKEQDRLVGLGASDMKAGLAVMLEVLTPEALDLGAYNLIQIYYSGEEGPHNHNEIHRVLDNTPQLNQIDLAFVLEPTDNNLQLGCLGSINATVTFWGKRAHSARPWHGQNAIYKATDLLLRLQNIEPRVRIIDGFEFREVITATQASTGDNASNVVPDEFSINLNARFGPGRSVDEVHDRILELAGEQAEVEFVEACPSCPIPSNNEVLDKFRTLFKLPEEAKQAYTDVAVFAQHGIPAVNCGPGHTAQAHQQGEYVLYTSLIKSYQIFWTLLLGNL
jgi:succinyl-diaminopimelate desuccinylase